MIGLIPRAEAAGFQPMRILITGGAGFLGSHLCERLLNEGNEIICLDNFFTGRKANIAHLLDNPYFELVRHDVTEPFKYEVDQIYNLACPASPPHYQHNPIKTTKTSVMGAIHCLGLAKRVGARVFQASTSEVYGDPDVHPQPESYHGNVNPIGIRACYDEGKRCAETLFFDYHRQNKVDIRVVRIFNTYGPRMLPDDGRVFQRLVIARQGGSFSSRVESGELNVQSRLASGVIRSSLFAATDEAGLPDSVAVQLAEMFSGDIDFRRDLREGDRFSVVYESLEADGEALRAGRVLSAEFINNGREHEAVWFEEPGLQGAYYGFDGQSSRKSYLASPLEFSRVSSGYGMRFHPISGKQKAHLGVDYAAPTGTPVRTIADGVVTFAGWQRGYGNTIEVRHRDNQTTLFGHLSRIDVRAGQKVAQGEFIGAVGSTGLSTGPHLHFEFRDNGVHQDPLAIARRSENIPVSPAARARFDAVAQSMRMQLDAAATVQQASAE